MSKFLRALTACRTIEEVEKLLRIKTQRWRGRPLLILRDAGDVEEDESGDKEGSGDVYDGLALLA